MAEIDERGVVLRRMRWATGNHERLHRRVSLRKRHGNRSVIRIAGSNLQEVSGPQRDDETVGVRSCCGQSGQLGESAPEGRLTDATRQFNLASCAKSAAGDRWKGRQVIEELRAVKEF